LQGLGSFPPPPPPPNCGWGSKLKKWALETLSYVYKISHKIAAGQKQHKNIWHGFFVLTINKINFRQIKIKIMLVKKLPTT